MNSVTSGVKNGTVAVILDADGKIVGGINCDSKDITKQVLDAIQSHCQSENAQVVESFELEYINFTSFEVKMTEDGEEIIREFSIEATEMF